MPEPLQLVPPLLRVPTHVPGLDRMLEGGLLQGGMYLITGPPGAGKTILGNQISFGHITAGGHVVYLTLLSESHARMLRNIQPLTFFDRAAIGVGVHYLSASGVFAQEGFTGLLESIRRTVPQHQASLLVMDGLDTLEHPMRTPTDDMPLNHFLNRLQIITEAYGCTTLLLSHQAPTSSTSLNRTMVDGVIELASELVNLRTFRSVHVTKFRGSPHLPGKHDYAITDAGVVVYPRAESIYGWQTPLPLRHARVSTGVAGLDVLLRGGIWTGSIVLLFGPAGCGKTTLGLHMLAGGLATGAQALYFSFAETPDDLRDKTQEVGQVINRALQEGKLHAVWQNPVEQIPDAIIARLLGLVEEHGVGFLCLDGLDLFRVSLRDQTRLEPLLTALLNELRARGVTTIATLELPDIIGPSITSPVDGMLRQADTIIFLRIVELQSELTRLISILKARETDCNHTIRVFTTTDKGIELASTFDHVDAVMTGIAHPQPAPAPPSSLESRDADDPGC